MALAHTLGFPRIGADRELKKALESYWKGDLDQDALNRIGQQLRVTHWQLQKDAGIDLLPVGDFAWYDQVLTHSLTFGVIPERFDRTKDAAGLPTLDTLFAMARGATASCCGGDHGTAQYAQELTKWFDTNYHYLVPEFTADQQFKLSWEQLFDEVDEAKALGHNVKPVIIGPLTYLWLGKGKSKGGGNDFDKLDLLERLLPVYNEILGRLAAQGVEWVQIDEPILTLDLPQAWKNAFERAYHILQYSPLKKLVATYFSGLEDNLGLAVSLPVQGLHIDAVRAPDQLGQVLDRLLGSWYTMFVRLPAGLFRRIDGSGSLTVYAKSVLGHQELLPQGIELEPEEVHGGPGPTPQFQLPLRNQMVRQQVRHPSGLIGIGGAEADGNEVGVARRTGHLEPPLEGADGIVERHHPQPDLLWACGIMRQCEGDAADLDRLAIPPAHGH